MSLRERLSLSDDERRSALVLLDEDGAVDRLLNLGRVDGEQHEREAHERHDERDAGDDRSETRWPASSGR